MFSHGCFSKYFAQRWQEETKKTETTLKHQSVFDDPVKENMPPVRGSSCFVPLSQVKKIKAYTVHNQLHICIEDKYSNRVFSHDRKQFHKKERNPRNAPCHVITENGTSESCCLHICLLYSEERPHCCSS